MNRLMRSLPERRAFYEHYVRLDLVTIIIIIIIIIIITTIFIVLDFRFFFAVVPLLASLLLSL